MDGDGHGLLAIVELEGKQVAVLGVSPWRPDCFGERSLRAETLDGETVYVADGHFDTGCGTKDSEIVWTLRRRDLRIAGRYITGAAAAGDCAPIGIEEWQEKATARYSGTRITLLGETRWRREEKEDGGPVPAKGRLPWVETYVLRDGKVVQEPVPAGAPRRDAFPGHVAASPPAPEPEPGEDACAKGNARECLHAGDHLRDFTADKAREAQLYERACAGGVLEGCYELGVHHQRGQGVAHDDAHARRLYDRACRGGVLEACANLGWYYGPGRGASRDYARARQLDDRACAGGVLKGCANLAALYRTGHGVVRDYSRTRELFERACTDDVDEGCAGLGGLYAAGEGVVPDYAHARQLFERTCVPYGPQGGCTGLGDLYHAGHGVTPNATRAAQLWYRACKNGDMDGCVNLAKAYADGRGVTKDTDRAAALLEHACVDGGGQGGAGPKPSRSARRPRNDIPSRVASCRRTIGNTSVACRVVVDTHQQVELGGWLAVRQGCRSEQAVVELPRLSRRAHKVIDRRLPREHHVIVVEPAEDLRTGRDDPRRRPWKRLRGLPGNARVRLPRRRQRGVVLGKVDLEIEAAEPTHRTIEDEAPLDDPDPVARAVVLVPRDDGHIPLVRPTGHSEHRHHDRKVVEWRSVRRPRVLADHKTVDLDDELPLADRVPVDGGERLDPGERGRPRGRLKQRDVEGHARPAASRSHSRKQQDLPSEAKGGYSHGVPESLSNDRGGRRAEGVDEDVAQVAAKAGDGQGETLPVGSSNDPVRPAYIVGTLHSGGVVPLRRLRPCDRTTEDPDPRTFAAERGRRPGGARWASPELANRRSSPH